MDKVYVTAETLSDLSNVLKTESEKLLDIVSNISQATINYEEMLISDAGELFRSFMVHEQEKEKNKIIKNNEEIADKLLDFSNIYIETKDRIGDLVK